MSTARSLEITNPFLTLQFNSLKQKLVLPSTANDWKMLDDYLKVQVLPSVLCATDPESKYTVLVDGIYNSIAQCFGNIISHHNDFKNSKERRIEIRLLNVRMLKKECRRQYHRALRECWDSEALAALSRNWFKLIRQHNQLRLRLVKKQVWNKTKELQQKCDKNFWGFVSSVFNDKSNSPNVSNHLDMKTVTAHFTETSSRGHSRPASTDLAPFASSIRARPHKRRPPQYKSAKVSTRPRTISLVPGHN